MPLGKAIKTLPPVLVGELLEAKKAFDHLEVNQP